MLLMKRRIFMKILQQTGANEPMKLTPYGWRQREDFFVHESKVLTEAQAETAFGKLQIVKVASLPDEFGFITAVHETERI